MREALDPMCKDDTHKSRLSFVRRNQARDLDGLGLGFGVWGLGFGGLGFGSLGKLCGSKVSVGGYG